MPVKSSRRDKKEISGKGTVKFLSFEGGFYGIVGDNDKRYDPLNLPPEFKVDGLRVRFTGIVADHTVSFHTWGYMIRLLSIESLI